MQFTQVKFGLIFENTYNVMMSDHREVFPYQWSGNGRKSSYVDASNQHYQVNSNSVGSRVVPQSIKKRDVTNVFANLE